MRIRLEDVTFVYDRGLPTAREGLRGVSLVLRPDETVAVMGPTGSGKTTLLEVTAGLAHPSRGSVSVTEGDGATLRSSVGLVYQFPELQFFEETVFDEVAFGLRAARASEETVRVRVRAALERVGLDPDRFLTRSPVTLSAGEQRRAAIAAIVVLERPFLLLDEPSAGLDPDARERILELLLREREEGRSIVLVTHDPELAERVADRLVVVADGRIEADRAPDDAFSDAGLLSRLGLEAPPAHELVNALARRNAALAREVGAVFGRARLRQVR